MLSVPEKWANKKKNKEKQALNESNAENYYTQKQIVVIVVVLHIYAGKQTNKSRYDFSNWNDFVMIS